MQRDDENIAKRVEPSGFYPHQTAGLIPRPLPPTPKKKYQTPP